MGNKYDEITYTEVRQALGYGEADDTADETIDSLPRAQVFRLIAQWEGVNGGECQKWVQDIWGIDLDAEVGEHPYVAFGVKDGNKKYPEYIYRCLRQREGLDEYDDSRDDEFDTWDYATVLNEVATWNGLIDYGNIIIEWVDAAYNIYLAAE